jgi:PPM family protein phosphatase
LPAKTRLNNLGNSVIIFFMKCHLFSAMTLGPRDKQEDCIVAGAELYQAEEIEEKRQLDVQCLLLAVCDGMGGHDSGETASRFACEQLKKKSLDPISDPKGLNDILADIQISAQEHLPENSGTTVAGLIAREGKTIVFNAGDSRVYKLTPEGLKYISHDHSLVQELVDKSLIDREVASSHPLKNLIEFGIGPIFADAWGQHNIHIYEESITGGEIYLICSDGLVGVMTETEIFECLMPSPVEQGARLLEMIKNKGLADNTSFIIAELHQ